jgi:hypothetical protein
MYQNTILREAELNPIWQEQDGLLIVEVGSVPLKGIHTRALSFKGVWDEWVADADTGGHTGACCYRWGGPELTWNPGSGLLRYRLHIESAGEYALAIRSRQAPEATGDSCFVRVDGGQWWIARAATQASGWSWETRRERGPDRLEPYRENLDAGFHQIEISGRSHGFCIDRVALARNGIAFQDPSLRVSPPRPR